MKIDLAQLEFINITLRKMVLWAEQRFIDIHEFEVTSLYRMNDNGVHGQLPLRGIDIGCQDDAIGERIEQEVNAHYQYDPQRPALKCCMYHDVGLGKHLHFQVHPNTVRREQ